MLYARHSWVAYGMWVRHALLARPFRSLAAVLSAHMESEGTKGYTKREMRELFGPGGCGSTSCAPRTTIRSRGRSRA